MKAILVGAVAIAVLIGVVVYEEGRISTLEKDLAALKDAAPKASPGVGNRRLASAANGPATGIGKASRVGVGIAGTSPKNGKAREGDWAETFRQMMENPVGAAMIKEEHKGKALRIYGDFMESLNLNKKEKEYFLGLVAAGVGEDDTVGMKLLGAKSNEERGAILDRMEADQKARKKAIAEFLNDDDDYARYDHFEERKDIYEQMPGLRAAMTATGVPIDESQEEQLVEAIYGASVDSGLNEDWSGRAGMEQFGEPGATQRFKDQWGEMQSILNQSVGPILENSDQQTAFRDHQSQVGQMVVMSLQFVESMIPQSAQGGDE